MACCEYGIGRPGLSDHTPDCYAKRIAELEAENAKLLTVARSDQRLFYEKVAENQRLRELVGEMLSAWDQAQYFDSDKYRRRFLQITA